MVEVEWSRFVDDMESCNTMDESSNTITDASLHELRKREYPSLKDTIYLDNAGTPPIPKTLIDRFAADMIANLYGNPHSASPSSQRSTQRLESVRHAVLAFFNADPARFDLVFVANATAGVKLVIDAFRDQEGGFWYGYHADSHTSLVGARELARGGSRCFASDGEVEDWLSSGAPHSGDQHHIELFAYPAQSNMNGRRLPLSWCKQIRNSGSTRRYSLLDAAALVSTSPLDLSDPLAAPDFTVLSFYKIFGFPDLGALIVRKDSASILQRRKYFGGGTVDMVVSIKEQWHAPKRDSIHAMLEDGTLPIHNIFALGHALDVHGQLFGSLSQVSERLAKLAQQLYSRLADLSHSNGKPLCVIYKDPKSTYGDTTSQGPIVAFNMRNSAGAWIINAEVEKLASIRNIHLRAGGLCNPGGIATALGLEPWEMKQNFSAGHRCGSDSEVVSGKPTGMLRVSLGAMSTMSDVDGLVQFLQEFFVDDTPIENESSADAMIYPIPSGEFCVESLMIYPIKSCAGWKIPADLQWGVRKEGLAWDREWCLVHQGSGVALSQKKYPKMALLRPCIDLDRGVLRVRFIGPQEGRSGIQAEEVAVPLSADPNYFELLAGSDQSCSVCGDDVQAKAYLSNSITEFFSSALGVPCKLVRFTSRDCAAPATRQAKARFQKHQILGAEDAQDVDGPVARPILLSNESPILTISRSSLNRLNERIKARGGKAVQAEVFRANIVLSQSPASSSCGTEQPYVEDYWRVLQIGGQYYQMLGSCRRCQMVCVDQQTAQKSEEPFVTLARTRRFDGRVWFGQHMSHLSSLESGSAASQFPTLMVGDPAVPFFQGECSDGIIRRACVASPLCAAT